MKKFQVTYKGEASQIAKVDGANNRLYWSFDDANDYQQMSPDFFAKHNPQPGDYFLRYEDGTTEYMSAAVYERDLMTDEERKEKEEALKAPKQDDGDKIQGNAYTEAAKSSKTATVGGKDDQNAFAQKNV